MRSWIPLFVGLCLACASPPPRSGEDAYRETVRALLAATGGLALGEQMANAFFESFLENLRRQNADLTPRAIEILKEVAADVYGDTLADENRMLDLFVPIYERHFTQSDLESLVAFYRTPVGRKTVREMPTILQETMQSVQGLVPATESLFRKKLRERLVMEGISLPGI